MNKIPALRISNLTFRYYEHSKKNIIENLSLSIESGSVNVILGRSGCGKSTLAAVSAGLYPENGGVISSGEIEIFGHSIRNMTHKERAGYLTLMFQNPELQFCMNTVKKEIIFCLENIAVQPDKMDEIIFNTASKLGISDLLDKELSKLSGGEKQKVSLCCLLALGSKCIILDEAFANIDRESAFEIIYLLKKYKASGGTIIAIEHNPEIWRSLADRYILMGESCRILEENILALEFDKYREFLALNGIYGSYSGRKFFRETQAENIISFKNVSVINAGEYILKNASVNFKKNRITALIGRSGIGKTTTFLCILRQHPFEGTIEINGQDIKKLKERELFSMIGIVFQNPANQFVTQKLSEEIMTSISDSIKPEKLEKLISDYGLKEFMKYSPYMLSQGQQRRLAVLSIVLGKQKIILLDEPTYGQDLNTTEAIMKQLNEKVEHENLTVIFITHDEQLANKWADNIIKIENQKFVYVK